MRGSGSNKILERLDRGLGSSDFLNYFPNILEVHVTRESSDHLPLLFKFYGHKYSTVTRKKQFRFENFWLTYDACSDIVRKAWSMAIMNDAEGIVARIENCGHDFSVWNREVVGNIPHAIRSSISNLRICFVVWMWRTIFMKLMSVESNLKISRTKKKSYGVNDRVRIG